MISISFASLCLIFGSGISFGSGLGPGSMVLIVHCSLSHLDILEDRFVFLLSFVMHRAIQYPY